VIVPPQAVALVKREEGLVLHPYRCPAGWPTIGYGHVIPSMDHPNITHAEAERLLVGDLAIAQAATVKYCPGLAVADPRRLAAIVSFTFNLGSGRLRTSTLRKRINERNWPAAERELKRWKYAGAKVLPGLVRRRQREADLLMLRVA
jgi:lysozyme